MSLKEEFWFACAVVYSKINPFMIRHFGMDKVGFFLQRLKQPRTVDVEGFRFRIEPEIYTCFGRMIGGSYNEGETHLFFHRILEHMGKIDMFMDIGSNVGEFIVDMAASGKVTRVVGFEPNPYCVKSSLESIALNGLKNIEIRQTLLKDFAEPTKFDVGGFQAHVHSIFDSSSEIGEILHSSTLDREFPGNTGNTIVLIDVEGAETLVMKGGRNFIAGNQPLIVFEYNEISRQHFSLNDVTGILPEGYELFRLRAEDGFLDRNFDETWNCVAVQRDSPFYSAALELLR